MLATLIIGLREGLEAALIVGIIAAFLRRQQRTDALRWMWVGVFVAVAICVAAAIGLEILSRDLPQQQQEALETIIGVIAVVMVTYMIVWMRQHSRDLKGDLEAAASDAMANGSAVAFVLMAFLAVLREGLETAVFLVAAFNASNNALPSAAGAVIGIVIAVILGYGIYRGGVRINLARFFKITGLLLVLVAAGLVMTAFHTAHEAGWIEIGQQQVIDLTWLVKPGSVQSSLLTGVLGLQPRPVLIEVVGWLVYVVVVGAVVLWPAGRSFPRRAVGLAAAVLAGVAALGALITVLTAPAAPTAPPATISAPITSAPTASGILAGHRVSDLGAVSVSVDDISTAQAADDQASGVLHTGAINTDLSALSGGWTTPYGDIEAPTYQQIASPDIPVESIVADAPETVTLAQVVAANGGRLPVGLDPRKFGASAPVMYTLSASVTVSLDPDFARPLATEITYALTATATPANGPATVLGKVYSATAATQPDDATLKALAEANLQQQQHHSRGVTIPITLAVLAGILALGAAALLFIRRPMVPARNRNATSEDPDNDRPSSAATVRTGPIEETAATTAPNEEKEGTR